jgi:hypothetical protein
MTITDPGWDGLFRRLYLQLKDGTVDREAAFDLACHVLSVLPLAEDATELARLCLEDGGESGIVAAARAFLSGRFDPGFAEEPGWLATLEEALEVVNRDMRASGLPGTGQLHVWEGGTAFEYAFVEVWDRYNSHGGGCRLAPSSAWVIFAALRRCLRSRPSSLRLASMAFRSIPVTSMARWVGVTARPHHQLQRIGPGQPGYRSPESPSGAVTVLLDVHTWVYLLPVRKPWHRAPTRSPPRRCGRGLDVC